MTVDERFAEHFALRDVVEALLDDVFLHLLKVLNVFAVRQLVKVDPVGLVTPQPDNLCRRRDAFVRGKQQAYTKLVTDIEERKQLLLWIS